MSRFTSLCTVALLLLLSVHRAFARPVPAFQDVTPMENHHNEVDNEVDKVYTLDNCEELADEECMMGRTLEAQLDYIYTQKGKHP